MPENDVFYLSCVEDIEIDPTIANNFSCDTIGQKVENPSSCEKYFTCVTECSDLNCTSNVTRIRGLSCPQTKMFDWKKKTCVDAFSANTVPGCKSTYTYKCMKSRPKLRIICSLLLVDFLYDICISFGCALPLYCTYFNGKFTC